MLDRFWVIDTKKTWPPPKSALPPFGVTTIENISSCGAKVHFSSSKEFSHKWPYETRLGNAMHKTLESLFTDPPNETKVLQESKKRLEYFMEQEDRSALINPRESKLPRNSQKIQLALRAIMTLHSSKVLALSEKVKEQSKTTPVSLPTQISEARVEFPIVSRNNLIRGKIDRIERRKEGLHIIDYKSSVRPIAHPHYIKQLQLYSVLLYENFNQWPSSAELVFPIVNKSFTIKLDRAACQSTLLSAYKIIEYFNKRNPAELAKPGNICEHCEFRPWCKPFWIWCESKSNSNERFKIGKFGIQGIVKSIEQESSYLFLNIIWGRLNLELNVPENVFPQLFNVKPNDVVRLLDFKLEGMINRPVLMYNEFSELYIVSN